MDDKDRIAIYSELLRVQMDHFKQTREIEFKVNVAIWTLIVVSASFLYGKIHIDSFGAWLVYILLALLVYFGHMLFWMLPIQNSEDTDDHFIQQYRSELERLAGATIQPPPVKKPKFIWRALKRGGWSWIFFEIGITGALLIGAGIVLSVTPVANQAGQGQILKSEFLPNKGMERDTPKVAPLMPGR